MYLTLYTTPFEKYIKLEIEELKHPYFMNYYINNNSLLLLDIFKILVDY